MKVEIEVPEAPASGGMYDDLPDHMLRNLVEKLREAERATRVNRNLARETTDELDELHKNLRYRLRIAENKLRQREEGIK